MKLDSLAKRATILYFAFAVSLFGFYMVFMLRNASMALPDRLTGLAFFSIFGGLALGQVIRGAVEIGMIGAENDFA